MHYGEARHQSLNSLDIVNMEADLFLKTVELLVHLDFEVVSTSLDLGLELHHLFLLVRQEGLPLVFSILVSKLLNPDSLFDL